MTDTDPTAHQSPSKLDLWSRCQRAWFYRYVEKLRTPPSAAMAWGSAHDDTANGVYGAKIATAKTPKLAEACEIYAASWRARTTEVPDLHPNDSGKMLDAGVSLTEIWHHSAARHIQPVAIQAHVQRPVEYQGETAVVHGYADLVARYPGETEPVVVDHKAGRRARGVSDLFQSTQALAYPFCTGLSRFALHCGTLYDSGTVKWKSLRRDVLPTDLDLFAAQVVISQRQQRHAIETGDFLPNRSHQLCSRRWCGFWERCEQDCGGRVAP